MREYRLSRLAVGICLVFQFCFAAAGAAQETPRIHESVNDSRRVVLTGNMCP